ncbi:hypothetical protein BaRGS_00037852 [Batillaria attramentaria]|uniref:Uncharacterized protein n=1 Tax=Batillaria attramentaria TaxID=370345 RepID=A0ABD0J7N8_9CAEN
MGQRAYLPSAGQLTDNQLGQYTKPVSWVIMSMNLQVKQYAHEPLAGADFPRESSVGTNCPWTIIRGRCP